MVLIFMPTPLLSPPSLRRILPLANPRERASWNEVEQNDPEPARPDASGDVSAMKIKRRGIMRTIRGGAILLGALAARKERFRKFDASMSNALGTALKREIFARNTLAIVVLPPGDNSIVVL